MCKGVPKMGRLKCEVEFFWEVLCFKEGADDVFSVVSPVPAAHITR